MTEGMTFKRRNILAVAGAVVAGIAMKQTAQPVAAAGLTLESANTVTAGTTTIKVAPAFANTVFEVDATASTANVLYIDAIRGRGQFNGAGIHAYGGQASPNTGPGPGAQGEGGTGNTSSGGFARDGAAGLYGTGGFGGNPGGNGGDGVHAGGGGALSAGKRGGYGVYAVAGSGGVTSGVYAVNNALNGAGNTGVTGICGTPGGVGVLGQIPSTSSAANTYAVQGFNMSSGAGGFGVQGLSFRSHGVYGEAGSDQGSGGVVGVSRVASGVGFQAVAISPAQYAGYFVGTVSITGSLGVSGSKFAVVKGTDGQYRGMYAVESPECWFEDFGTGTIVNGKAAIKLDPLFVQHIHTDSYHVFVSPHDAEQQLTATTRSGQGFTVEANAGVAKLNGKQLTDVSGTFSYRVVAKRNDIKGERLPIWEMPAGVTVPDPPKFEPIPTAPSAPVPPANLPNPQPSPAPVALSVSASLSAPAPNPLPPSRP